MLPLTRRSAFTLAALLASALGAHAQNVGSYGRSPRPANVDPASVQLPVIQKLGETIPLDTVLYDHSAQSVVLKDLLGGKPTIIVPAYYECPKLCNEVLNALLVALRESYVERGAAFWLSWLADIPAAIRLTISTVRTPRRWRGRSYAGLATGES